MAEQMNAIESERTANLVQLRDEAIKAPECRIVRAVRAAASQLIVKHNGTCVREASEGFQVIMGCSGTAVQDE
jgi:hypothetical protein